MEKKEIIELMQYFQQTGLTEITLQKDGFSLTLKNQPVAVTAAPISASLAVSATASTPPAPAPEGLVVTSPMVGTFYRKPKPSAPEFVQLNQQVAIGDVLCVIEAMKLFNEIQSEYSGKVVEILVKDGQSVEFGQPLFRILP